MLAKRHRMRFSLLLALAGCVNRSAEKVCEDLCSNLVSTCGYEAFPDHESCQQGCNYEASEGAAINTMYECIEEAECDTFKVLRCQHALGAE